MKILKESLSGILYHFCDFDSIYNIALSDRLILTSAYNKTSDFAFQRGRLFYISFTRQFNGNIGYAKTRNDTYDNQFDKKTGKKRNMDSSKLWTRITFDGDLLSNNYKGVQVNNQSHGVDVITNRQSEDRLVTNEPYISNIHNYVLSVDILLPKKMRKDVYIKRETMIRTMIIKSKFGSKIKVFTDEAEYNNPNSKNYIDPRNFLYKNNVDDNGNRLLKFSDMPQNKISAVNDINEYDPQKIGSLGEIANAMTFVGYGENITGREILDKYNLINIDNKEKQEETKIQLEKLYNERIRSINSINDINSFNRQFSNLRMNIGGETKWLYSNCMFMITNYMKEIGANSFKELIAYKKQLFKRMQQFYNSRRAVGENFNNRIKQIIQEVLDNVVKKKINAVIFDFDGTLVDTTAIDEFRSVAKKIKDPQERLDYYRKFFQETKVYPGIVNLLNVLNAMGVVVAIVSLSPKNMVQDLCKFHNLPINMNFVLTDGKKFNLVKGFQTGYSKSTIYRKIMEKLGIQPYSVLAVGDEITDEQQAKIAGINFIGCSWGGRNETSNSVSNPADVLRYVKGEI